MAEETVSAAKKPEDSAEDLIHSKRRYVGKKETVGYIFNHWSGGCNINKFRNRFIYDVLLVNFNYLAVLIMIVF